MVVLSPQPVNSGLRLYPGQATVALAADDPFYQSFSSVRALVRATMQGQNRLGPQCLCVAGTKDEKHTDFALFRFLPHGTLPLIYGP